MPEGRMLKRVISESKSLGNLSSDSARLLYTWLIPWLDVEGRHSADPEIIKGHIFPKIKSMTVSRIQYLLEDLAAEYLIVLYQGNGEKYLQLTKFAIHQKLDKNREAKSNIPAPTAEDVSTHENSGVTHENSTTIKVKLSLIKDKLSLSKATQAEIPALDTLFENFWSVYPKKAEKKVARKVWDRLVKTAKPEDIIAAAAAYAKAQETKGEVKYIKNPSTFLNEDRWKDWLPGSEAQQSIGIDPYWSKP